jgi:hypothetical protein
MFSPGIRWALVVLAGTLAGVQLAQGRWEGLIFVVVALLLAWGHFRHSTVHAAFQACRRGNLAGARALLAAVPDPRRLTRKDQAYYHWLNGGFLAGDGKMEEARAAMQLAADGALRTDSDRALVNCQLAELALGAGDREAAEEHLRIARSLPHKPQVAEVLAQLDGLVAKTTGSGSSPQAPRD